MRRLPALLILLLLAGCGGDGDERPTAEATPEPSVTETGCQKVEAPEPKPDGTLEAPKAELDPKRTYIAVVTTSCGSFEIELDVKRAPKTTASFVYLAKQAFYSNLSFNRISPGFVIQGGDPSGQRFGGPGYQVVEPPPADLRYTRGVVAMAKGATDPSGASGSTFFVVTGEDVMLPPDYALLGKVGEGQDVVDTIGTTATDRATEQPIDPVLIESITIKEG